MKQITLIFLLFTCMPLSAQLKFTKTGRPQTFEYNNAERTVGKRWGIKFDYVAFDGVNFDLLDSINAQNQVTENKLAAQKGADWNATFRAEVDAELERQKALRNQITGQIKDMPPFPIQVHFEQAKCSNQKYRAYVFSQMELEDQRKYYVNYQYKVNLKNGKIKLVSEKTKELHFEYPENGITR